MDFVIIGHARSGTTYTARYLNQIRGISSGGDYIHHQHGLYKGDVVTRMDPGQFLDVLKDNSITTNTTGKKIFGFKTVFYRFKALKEEHDYDFYQYFKQRKPKVVITNRRNIFLNYLSKKKAIASNTFTLYKSKLENNPDLLDHLKSIKVNIDVNEYYQYVNEYIQTLDSFKDFCNKNDIVYKEIFYEDFIGPERHIIFKGIAKFIGIKTRNIKPVQNEDIDLFKLNVYRLKDQISNFTEIKKLLKEDPYFKEALKLEKLCSGAGPYGLE
jgi:hypothetical protein